MHTGKSIKAMAAFLTAALLFTGCSGKTTSPDVPSEPSGSEQTAKSVQEIYQ